MAINPWEYAKSTEHSHQAALFMWANMACRFGIDIADDPQSYSIPGYALSLEARPIPQLKWLYAIHNQGHGDAIRGGKAKAEGVKAGVADLFLPVPSEAGDSDANWIVTASGKRMVCGLYLELKVGSNKPSDVQLEFMADMQSAGYAADWAIGWLDARKKILAYLQISS